MTKILGRWFGKNRAGAPVRDVAALTAPLATPAVQIVTTDGASRSHFGGSPNLPRNLQWPECNGKKLGFLARLSLSEIQHAHAIDWLPGTGALLFFYDIDEQPWGFDPKDRGSWAVLLVPDLDTPGFQPGNEPDPSVSPLPYRNVMFRRIDVLPSWERASVRALDLTDKESDVMFDLTDDVFQGDRKHQISGFPAPVQNDNMELECQLVSNGLYCGDLSGYSDERAGALKPGAENWRLLLQIDSDDSLNVMWGDSGIIYYWIEEQAARARCFESSWLILQCG